MSKRAKKALMLCMPITCSRPKLFAGPERRKKKSFRLPTSSTDFIGSCFHKTEGAEYLPEAVPEWKEDTALTRLNIRRVAFESLDGNIQGYAKPGRRIALNPVAALPHKTLFHELAHLLLGHTEETAFVESESTSREFAKWN